MPTPLCVFSWSISRLQRDDAIKFALGLSFLFDIVLMFLNTPTDVFYSVLSGMGINTYTDFWYIISTLLSCIYQFGTLLIITVFITADHGNAEVMIDYSNGKPFTAHTTDPVPFVWVSNHTEGKTLKNGKLADIAPTMLNVMGLEAPAEMTGENLIVSK